MIRRVKQWLTPHHLPEVVERRQREAEQAHEQAHEHAARVTRAYEARAFALRMQAISIARRRLPPRGGQERADDNQSS